ncbi:MAG: hypothetical protein GY839_03150 [candidate division Zixibacteria bacterium]|nr:hypothetical protein [candidate division Zixibacteria bacterium]
MRKKDITELIRCFPFSLSSIRETRSPKSMLSPPSIIFYFSFKILTVLVGAFSIYLGYRLFMMGVTGKASLVVDSPKVGGQLLNAAPGLFFAVGGIVIVIFAVVKGINVKQTEREMKPKSDVKNSD